MILAPPPAPPHHREPARAPRPGSGTGARVWLLRHGEVTAANVGTAYGDADVPLSDRGLAQTEQLAAAFGDHRAALAVSSPLDRSRRLGEAIARASEAPLRIDARLAELHRGDWQGLPREEYEKRWWTEREAYWSDPLGWSGHGGESEGALLERVWPGLAELAQEARSGDAAVLTTHRNVVRSLVAAALGVPVGQSHAIRIDPARGVLLADEPRGWTLMGSNLATAGGI